MASALETALGRAVTDPGFRADLIARRTAAVVAAGLPPLLPHERAVLDSIPAAQPEQTAGIRPDVACQGIRPDAIARGIRPDAPSKGIRPGIPIAVVGGAVLAGGITLATCTAGVRPDVPPAATPAAAGPPADAGPDAKPK